MLIFHFQVAIHILNISEKEQMKDEIVHKALA